MATGAVGWMDGLDDGIYDEAHHSRSRGTRLAEGLVETGREGELTDVIPQIGW